MNTKELAKYEKLVEAWIQTGEDMVKAQAESTIYGRKIQKLSKPTRAQQNKDASLIDKAFKAEYKAFKKADEYNKYKKLMKDKYN